MSDIKLFFKEQLILKGFKKRGNTFFKKTIEETYYILHMQKSQWSDSYYFNIGIKYNNIEDSFNLWNEKKAEWDCADFSMRLGECILEKESKLRGILLSGVENNDSFEVYNDILNYTLDFFDSFSTKKLFKEQFEICSNLPNIGITKELGEYCES